MSTPTVRKGERVRITRVCEGTVLEVLDGGQMVKLETSAGSVSRYLVHAGDAMVTVEVLEPEWRPGDVARDAKGRTVHYLPSTEGDELPWAAVDAQTQTWEWLIDADLARPLTPLVLRGVPQVTS